MLKDIYMYISKILFCENETIHFNELKDSFCFLNFISKKQNDKNYNI